MYLDTLKILKLLLQEISIQSHRVEDLQHILLYIKLQFTLKLYLLVHLDCYFPTIYFLKFGKQFNQKI